MSQMLHLDDESKSAAEELVRAACEGGDFKSAATLILSAYGAELYSFLLAQCHRDWDQTDDIFSSFKEDMWRGLPRFEWRCSVRAWCYRLARNAASRYRRSPQNRRQKHLSLEEGSFLNDLAERARTTTQNHLRSEVRDEVQKLRDELTQEDRDLLILRIDRNLAWREVAHAMLPNDEPADSDRARRLEVALRRRFVQVKNKLKLLAAERGLIPK